MFLFLPTVVVVQTARPFIGATVAEISIPLTEAVHVIIVAGVEQPTPATGEVLTVPAEAAYTIPGRPMDASPVLLAADVKMVDTGTVATVPVLSGVQAMVVMGVGQLSQPRRIIKRWMEEP